LVTLPEASALTDAYAVAKILSTQLPHLPIDVVINRVQSSEEADAAWERLATATARFLGRGLGFAGAIPEDPDMRTRFSRAPQLLLQQPSGPALSAVAALSDAYQLWERTSPSPTAPLRAPEDQHDTRQ
jgi:flagellar biosynthesis protein FlhG